MRLVRLVNHGARKIKHLLLVLFCPKRSLEASLNEVKKWTMEDDRANIRNDYKRIGDDLRKVIKDHQ